MLAPLKGCVSHAVPRFKVQPDASVTPAVPCCLAFSCRHAWGAHAARCHGYRARHTVVASGRTPGMWQNRLRRHLSNSAKCLRVVEACGNGPEDCTVGHDQAPPVCDTGVHACEAPEQMITSPFVQQLQEAGPTSFEELWVLVKQMVGPYQRSERLLVAGLNPRLCLRCKQLRNESWRCSTLKRWVPSAKRVGSSWILTNRMMPCSLSCRRGSCRGLRAP